MSAGDLAAGLRRLARDRADIEAFARAEALEAHARAVAIRFES